MRGRGARFSPAGQLPAVSRLEVHVHIHLWDGCCSVRVTGQMAPLAATGAQCTARPAIVHTTACSLSALSAVIASCWGRSVGKPLRVQAAHNTQKCVAYRLQVKFTSMHTSSNSF